MKGVGPWGLGMRVDYYETEDGVERKQCTGTVVGPGPLFTHVMVQLDPVGEGGCQPVMPLPISCLKAEGVPS